MYVISCIRTDRQDQRLIFLQFDSPLRALRLTQTPKALVHDILPPTIAITDHATGLGKLSATGQVYVGALMAVSL